MHINTRDGRFANGQGRTDPDLVLHFPVAHQSGRLIGPGLQPKEVFAPVRRSLVLRAMAKELLDAVDSSTATPEYTLLNACRNLAYMNEGHLYSKIDGGTWVLAHLPDIDAALVRAAMDRQEGGNPSAPVDETATRRVARRIADRLTTEAARR
jgi:streptomycin 3"-adenylyltransferase